VVTPRCWKSCCGARLDWVKALNFNRYGLSVVSWNRRYLAAQRRKESDRWLIRQAKRLCCNRLILSSKSASSSSSSLLLLLVHVCSVVITSCDRNNADTDDVCWQICAIVILRPCHPGEERLLRRRRRANLKKIPVRKFKSGKSSHTAHCHCCMSRVETCFITTCKAHH